MLCRSPYMQGIHARPCGQCMPCLFNRRRMWTHRIMLEAAQHGDNAFVTLTYDEDHNPVTLIKRDLQLFMKRFRESIAPTKVRFYGVGEYGERTERPHYHLALFGWSRCRRWHPKQSAFERVGCTCFACSRIREAWLLGGIDNGALSVESAQYVAGYVTKKMTNKNDPLVRKALGNRDPEFCLMSRRPGIGVGAMHEVASSLMQFNLDTRQSDVPVTLAIGKRQMPLGRHLRRKLREFIGKDASPPPALPKDVVEEIKSVQELFKATRKIEGVASLKEMNVLLGNQKVANMKSRQQVFKKGKKL